MRAASTAEIHDPHSLHAQLRDGAERLGVRLDAAALARLDAYLALLQLWGRKINLTAIPLDDVERIATLHFLDSLACVARLPLLSDLPQPTLIDVGSGAGFPGVLCALLRPDLRVTLVERVASSKFGSMNVMFPANVLPGCDGVVMSTLRPGLIHGRSCS